MSEGSRGIGRQEMEQVNPLRPPSSDWQSHPVSDVLRSRAQGICGLSSIQSPNLKSLPSAQMTHPGAPGCGICSSHLIGPQHLQDLVLVHTCVWKWGAVLSSTQEVCSCSTMEKVNHHTPPLEVDALIDWSFPGGAVVKNLPADGRDVRDVGSTPGSGRSPGVGNGKPLQCSCLENSTDRGDWQAIVHRVTKSWTGLSTHALLDQV